MKPKEKADALIQQYFDMLYELSSDDSEMNLHKAAKQCALIAVEERLEDNLLAGYKFWKEVKEEITKL